MQGDANRHVRVLWNHRSNPDLEDLRPPRNIRIGKKLIHPAWKRFDIGIVTIVHSSSLTNPVVKVRR